MKRKNLLLNELSVKSFSTNLQHVKAGAREVTDYPCNDSMGLECLTTQQTIINETI